MENPDSTSQQLQNISTDSSQPPIKTRLNNKLIGVVVLCLIIPSVVIASISLKKEKHREIEKTAPTITSILPNPSPLPHVTFAPGIETQSFERAPTKNTLKEEVYISVSGGIFKTSGRYSGMFVEGLPLPITDYNKKEEQKRNEKLRKEKESPEMLKSSFVMEIRDVANKVLLSFPIATGLSSSGDIINITYGDEPGPFSAEVLLPVSTNSIVLKKRSGEVLDRVYVESWDPEVKVSNYPKILKSSDTFSITAELLPGKVYSYTLFLRNKKDNTRTGIIAGGVSPVKGKITEQVDLTGYTFAVNGDWVVEAVGYSLFKTKTTMYEPISISISSDNITVRISKKNKTFRRDGEHDSLEWTQMFYDTSDSLAELCQKGRCFELTWSGDGVDFESQSKEGVRASSLISQKKYIECTFHGKGTQKIHLEVKENGNVIGNDTYIFQVNGTTNEPSHCIESYY